MKHRLRTPLYELLRSWQMPMVRAVKICRDTEQLATDLATFRNQSIEDTIKMILPIPNLLKDARKYGIKI